MRHSRPRSSPRPLIAVALTLGALALTAGCGGQDPVTADPSEVTSSTPASPTATATPPTTATSPAAPATTATTPKPHPTHTPSDDSGDQVGNGDADDALVPATAGGGVCAKLPATQVGKALGSPVHGSAIPGGNGGCQFTGGTDATVVDRPYVASQGMKPAKDEATSAIEGTPEDLTGIGTAAFVVTGSKFGGDSIQGAGAVHAGPRVVSVTVDQESGMTAAQVRAKVIAVLKLVAGKL